MKKCPKCGVEESECLYACDICEEKHYHMKCKQCDFQWNLLDKEKNPIKK